MPSYTLDEIMKAYAGRAVELAKDLDMKLDFSEASLKTLDQILDQYHRVAFKKSTKNANTKPSDAQIEAMCAVWGSYLAEVILRHVGGRYIRSKQLGNGAAIYFDDKDLEASPWTRVNKILLNGSEESVGDFYEAIKGLLSPA